MSRRPVFLERRGYRRRRVMDAARMLPVAGLFLLLMPLLWAGAHGGVAGTAGAGLYVFGVWGGLIAAALVFARALSRPEPPGEGAPGEGRGG
jgi:hypothetical protein